MNVPLRHESLGFSGIDLPPPSLFPFRFFMQQPARERFRSSGMCLPINPVALPPHVVWHL